MSDLFNKPATEASDSYSAKDIEILEGLEPVRKRPGDRKSVGRERVC